MSFEQAWIRKRQADAMAQAQACGLVAHVCAMHRGHPHAAGMLEDDLQQLTESGGLELVAVALGEILGEHLGHQQAIDGVGDRRTDPSETHFVVTLATALAKAIDFDGERALTEQRVCELEAHARGVSADALKELGD